MEMGSGLGDGMGLFWSGKRMLVEERSFGLHENGLIDPVVLGSRCLELGVECHKTRGPNGSERGRRFRVIEGVMFTTTPFLPTATMINYDQESRETPFIRLGYSSTNSKSSPSFRIQPRSASHLTPFLTSLRCSSASDSFNCW